MASSGNPAGQEAEDNMIEDVASLNINKVQMLTLPMFKQTSRRFSSTNDELSANISERQP